MPVRTGPSRTATQGSRAFSPKAAVTRSCADLGSVRAAEEALGFRMIASERRRYEPRLVALEGTRSWIEGRALTIEAAGPSIAPAYTEILPNEPDCRRSNGLRGEPGLVLRRCSEPALRLLGETATRPGPGSGGRPPVVFRGSPLIVSRTPPYRAAMTLGWFLGWSTFVGISWVALAAAFADDEACSFLCFTFADLLVLLIFPAAIVWSLGLIVLYVVRRLRPRAARCGPDHRGEH